MHYSDLKRSPCVTFLLPPVFVKNRMCLSLTPVLHFYRQKSCQRATVLILLKCFQSKTERLSFAHTTLLRNTFNPKLSGYLQQLQASFMRSQLVSAMLCSDHRLIILHVNENIPIFLMLQLTSSLIKTMLRSEPTTCVTWSLPVTRSRTHLRYSLFYWRSQSAVHQSLWILTRTFRLNISQSEGQTYVSEEKLCLCCNSGWSHRESRQKLEIS